MRREYAMGLLLFTSFAVWAKPGVQLKEKDFEVKESGTLHLAFPASWANSSQQATQQGKPIQMITFTPAQGDDFAVVVQVLNPGGATDGVVDTKKLLESMGQQELPGAVEKTLDIKEIKGDRASGSYFSITDKDIPEGQHKAGEYRYLTEGYATVGGLVIHFRMVSHRKADEEKAAAVEMIRTARLAKK